MKKHFSYIASSLATSAMVLALGAPAMAQDLGEWQLITTPESTAAAAAAGLADAARDGGPAELPQEKTIGLILLSMQSPANYRIARVAEEIAERLGYRMIICDPDFDPQRVMQCATSIMAQRPDAVISDAHEPAALGAALNDAYDMGIPWFSLVVNVSEHPAISQYGITGREVGAVYDEWLFRAMAERHGTDAPLGILAIGAPALGAALLAQQEQLAEDVAATTGVEVLVQHDLDLGNAVQDTLSITEQTWRQNANLAGTWTVCDFCVSLMAQVFDSLDLTGDDRPIIGGNYTTPQGAELMREGWIDGFVDIPFEASVYVVFDQLLQYWARDTPINQDEDKFATAYSVPFMEPYMVTAENIGDGPIPIFGSDYETYFAAKWGAEFGIGSE